MNPRNLGVSIVALSFTLSSWVWGQSSFDLRTAGPGGVSWVSAVSNQLLLGDCWTFSSATAIDSNLIKNGLLSTSANPPALRISPWHLSARNGSPEWLPYNSRRQSWENDRGGFSWGGFHWQTMAYLTRGRGEWPTLGGDPPNTVSTFGGGPVLISQNALNAFPVETITARGNLEATLPPSDQEIQFLTRGVKFFDQRGSGRNLQLQVDTVKRALQSHGALATYMYVKKGWSGEPLLYSGSGVANHSVTIIGWDDEMVIRGRKGAWIVQNSWGTGFGQQGIFYASYADKFIGRSGVMGLELGEMGNNHQTMLQNELGPIELNGANNPLGMGVLPRGQTRNTNEVLSVLSIEQASVLTGLGLASHRSGTSVSFRIYQGGFDPSTGLTGEPIYSSGQRLFDAVGYQLFTLDTAIELAVNSQLVVVVDYEDRVNVVPFVLGSRVEPLEGGLSFFNSGRGWRDFAQFGRNGGTFFVKGVTAPIENQLKTLAGFSPVPEPSAFFTLLPAGLLLLLIRRRRACSNSIFKSVV